MIEEIIQQIEWDVMNKLKEQRKQEREELEKIADLTSITFAIIAAEHLNCQKHPYSFEAYLLQLHRLLDLLLSGEDAEKALELIELCL